MENIYDIPGKPWILLIFKVNVFTAGSEIEEILNMRNMSWLAVDKKLGDKLFTPLENYTPYIGNPLNIDDKNVYFTSRTF